MKAISIRQPYAQEILTGKKWIECRSWSTNHRGPLLICAGKTWDIHVYNREADWRTYPLGKAICVADVIDCHEAIYSEFEWELDNIQAIEPFQVKGKLGLFAVDDELIKRVGEILKRSNDT